MELQMSDNDKVLKSKILTEWPLAYSKRANDLHHNFLINQMKTFMINREGDPSNRTYWQKGIKHSIMALKYIGPNQMIHAYQFSYIFSMRVCPQLWGIIYIVRIYWLSSISSTRILNLYRSWGEVVLWCLHTRASWIDHFA